MITFFEPEWTAYVYRNPCAKVTAAICLIAIALLTSAVCYRSREQSAHRSFDG
jgi:hypothetical protein